MFVTRQLARMAGAFSAVTMKWIDAVFLLLVATYFLLAPEGVAGSKPDPKPSDSGLPAQ